MDLNLPPERLRFRNRLACGEIFPWRISHRGGLYQTLIGNYIRRWYWKQYTYPKKVEPLSNDITVIIPFRNRSDYRLVNALKSIRSQDYNQSLIYPVVVDYGSSPKQAEKCKKICSEQESSYFRIDTDRSWNKSHAINTILRDCKSKYFLQTDVDIIFPKRYVSSAIQKLQKCSFSVVYSKVLDLSEDTEKYLKDCAKNNILPDDKYLCEVATPRSKGDSAPGIICTFTHFLKYIRGYDEFYTLWGFEDNDMQRRLYWLGLNQVSLAKEFPFFHQWHKKLEGHSEKECLEQYERNKQYYDSSFCIKRNTKSWGQLPE